MSDKIIVLSAPTRPSPAKGRRVSLTCLRTDDDGSLRTTEDGQLRTLERLPPNPGPQVMDFSSAEQSELIVVGGL